MKKWNFKLIGFIILFLLLSVNLNLEFNAVSSPESINSNTTDLTNNKERNNPIISIYEEWNLSIDGTANGDDRGLGVTVDSQGYVYITGYVVNIDTEKDIILRKYNSNGDLEWENITDGPWNGVNDNDVGYDVAVDDTGDVYITGYLSNTSDHQGRVCFLMKFNSTGSLNWSTTWNDINGDWAQGQCIAIDEFDNIYVAGTFMDQIAGQERGFLLKYNKTGDINWSRAYHPSISTETQIQDVIIDSENNITLVGWNKTGSDYDIQIAKYNQLGLQIWNRTFNQEISDKARALSIDSNDNLYITGTIGPTATSLIVLVKYDKKGQYINNITFQDGANIARGIDISCSTDQIFIASEYYTNGNNNCTILSYNNTLDLQWKYTWDKGGFEAPMDICVNPFGYLYMIGVQRGIAIAPFDILFAKFSLSPPKFSLFGNSLEYPDSDGTFQLNWTKLDIINTDNYTLYNYTSYITEINGSLNIMAKETTQTTWNIADLAEGTYYYIVEAHNGYGNTTSNCLEVIVKFSTPIIGGVSDDDDDGGGGDKSEDNLILIVFIITGVIVAVSLVGFIVTKKFRKGWRSSEIPTKKLMEYREEVTEGDVLISKEKHFCLVHKGPIEGYTFICPTCGAYYCARCIEAIKEIENICWSCKTPIDPSMPTKLAKGKDEIKVKTKDGSKDMGKKAKNNKK